MASIRSRVMGPGKELTKRPRATPAVQKRLVELFQQMLPKKGSSATMSIGGQEFARTYVEFRKAGPGAAVAIWLRTEPNSIKLDERAVSVLLGGQDDMADRKVMAALRRLARRWAYPAKVYEQIERDPRPTITTLFLDRAAYEEPIFCVAAECLAAAFLVK